MTARALGSVAAEKLTIANLFNVEGWVCVVTGGGTGLGLVTAKALAQNGAKVYITGRRGDVLEQACKDAAPTQGKGSLHAVQGDATDKEQIKKMVQAVEKEEKYINLLINNHGVSLGQVNLDEAEQTAAGLGKKMFEEETLDRWMDTYKINTASYFFTSFAFLHLLGAAKTVGGYPEPGNIINIASISGVTKTAQGGQFAYNAGKAGTISLSHQLATEFARRGLGIRVNVVNPGYFPSQMTAIDPKDNTGSEAHEESFRKEPWNIPFGRPGGPEDYAQCIFGIAVNRYQTGSEVTIDGAWLLQNA